MNADNIEVLCTTGAGLEPVAAADLAPLSVGSIKKIQGKLLFTAKISNLNDILKCKLIERVFICLLYADLGKTNDVQSILSSIKNAVRHIDWNNFAANHRYVWLNHLSHPEFCNSVPSRLSIPASTTPITARLFVKLRPKTLIRHTLLVDSAVSDMLQNGLKVKFSKSSKTEVNLMLSNGTLFLGLPLTNSPLSFRRYIKHFGLRSTSAAAMTRNVKSGLVLDPMCGKGSILAEAASDFLSSLNIPLDTVNRRPVYLIGCDVSGDQLVCCRNNLLSLFTEHMNTKPPWDLVQCSLERPPFRSNLFDHIVCDIPFGKKHGIRSGNVELFDIDSFQTYYMTWLDAIVELLNQDGTYDILVPSHLRALSVSHLEEKNRTKIGEQIPVKLGTTCAVILSGQLCKP